MLPGSICPNNNVERVDPYTHDRAAECRRCSRNAPGGNPGRAIRKFKRTLQRKKEEAYG